MYFVNPPCMKQNYGHSSHQRKYCHPYDENPYKKPMHPMDVPHNHHSNMNNPYNQYAEMNNPYDQYPNMNNPFNQYPEMNNPHNQYSDMNDQYPLNFQMSQGSQMPVFAAEPSMPPFSNGGMPMPMPTPMEPDLSRTPETLTDIYYTPGFLRTQIGKTMRVEFLMGTNAPLVDRIGKLIEVGASYILIEPIESNDTIMCDIYSIKFVTILNP